MTTNDLKKKKIAVLYGGYSREREVSLVSGQTVFDALKNAGLNVSLIDVAEDFNEQLERAKPDVAFLALHGHFGEDGCIQALLEQWGIAYTGSPTAASLLAMNKVAAKLVFLRKGVSTPRYMVIPPETPPEKVLAKKFGNFPWMAKPVSEGSSIGARVIHDERELREYLAGHEGLSAVLVEEFISGREFSVGILGEQALPVIELCAAQEFYDYFAKYEDNKTQYIVNPDIPAEVTKRLQVEALKAHRALGCRDYSRVDFLLDSNGKEFCLEANTLPGMTSHSLLPMGAKAIGLDFTALTLKILELAASRSSNK